MVPCRRVIVVITACLTPTSDEIRHEQYARGLHALVAAAPPDAEVVIVEGNGARPTSLDGLGVRVVYTDNNAQTTTNIGRKELLDVRAAIDDDFVVKLTGRYVVRLDAPFFHALRRAREGAIDGIARFGPYFAPLAGGGVTDDCITGLIGATAAVVRALPLPKEYESVEWVWARGLLALPRERLAALGRLGVAICPASNYYFDV